MSTLPPHQPAVSPKGSGASDEKSETELPFDVQLRTFWEKNHQAVYVGCVLVVLAIAGRYTYEAIVVQHEASVEAAYAAATTPAKLQAFARDNPTHPLAGAAYLRMADESYTAGNFSEALEDYDKAAAVLPGTPFATRALLGKGMCLIQSGKTTEGTAILQRLADDNAQLAAVRCEAAYHLASLGLEAGRADEVVRLTNLIMQIDTGGVWAQRSLQLRSRLPVPVAGTAPEKRDETTPAIKLKLPGS
ncbi:MAG TPA: tetratricopeptide repeat protein [Opitutaceae bacterium]|nr:tetratricopeptide repeat protein [Opitutaceae bacterium]